MSVGFRVFTQRELPAKEIVEGFRSIPAANIADCMGRLCAMSSQIRRMSAPSEENMVGVALTVKARPGDNLMLHKALNMAVAGDVIVVSNEGDRSQSLLGEIMMTYGRHKGLAGMVIDGPMRDVDSIYSLGVPMYAVGSTPGGPYKEGPGEINVPVSIGGVVVNPGDILVGDADGIVVIAPADAPELLGKAQAKFQKEQEIFRAIEAGTRDKTWIDRDLKARGCEVIDDYCK